MEERMEERMTGTRRRNDALLDAIRDAVLAELDEHGYPGVTFEGVARRARTSKPVLYRRYRTKPHLVLDAVRQSMFRELAHPDAGSLRGDLIAVLSALAAQFARFGARTYLSLLAEADDELLASVLESAGAVNLRTMTGVYDAARARGELGPAAIPDELTTVAVNLLRSEWLISRRLGTGTVEGIVDAVVLPLITRAAGGDERTDGAATTSAVPAEAGSTPAPIASPTAVPPPPRRRKSPRP